jgi:hypothetical protein
LLGTPSRPGIIVLKMKRVSSSSSLTPTSAATNNALKQAQERELALDMMNRESERVLSQH